jgi:hypothetical protein
LEGQDAFDSDVSIRPSEGNKRLHEALSEASSKRRQHVQVDVRDLWSFLGPAAHAGQKVNQRAMLWRDASFQYRGRGRSRAFSRRTKSLKMKIVVKSVKSALGVLQW